jgi:anti-sigma regulatory factor (Ser/Thr protein kinase)
MDANASRLPAPSRTVLPGSDPFGGHWTFAAEKGLAAEARSLLGAALGDLLEDQRDVAVLLASELFSNAVLHGAAPIDVDLTRWAGTLRVSVHDRSAVLPMPWRSTRGECGRGLLLVDSLSQRWGVTVESSGKTVWFEVSTN